MKIFKKLRVGNQRRSYTPKQCVGVAIEGMDIWYMVLICNVMMTFAFLFEILHELWAIDEEFNFRFLFGFPRNAQFILAQSL